jgi:hypothetical protein
MQPTVGCRLEILTAVDMFVEGTTLVANLKESHPMLVTYDRVLKLCRALKGFDSQGDLSLAGYRKSLPRLSSHADVVLGTPVLDRGGVDRKRWLLLGATKSTFWWDLPATLFPQYQG